MKIRIMVISNICMQKITPMKGYNRFIFVLIVLFNTSACVKNFNNPYDDNASKYWNPDSIDYVVVSTLKCKISWQQKQSHIDGFKIDKKINEIWVNPYAILPKDSLKWIDNDYIYDKSETYYRIYAFANNNISEKIGITVKPTEPKVSTEPVFISTITLTKAFGGGKIIDNNGAEITARGVCWDTNQSPSIDKNHSIDGCGDGSFLSSIIGFIRNKKYYVRAYATNIVGTSYGNEISFTPPPIVGDSFQGGIVAYIFKPGESGYKLEETHGIIAAKIEVNKAEWGCYGILISGADGTAIGTGNQNTKDIIANGCANELIFGFLKTAALQCNELVLNGYSDWYLPSKDELNKLYQNKSAIGGFAETDISLYWTSTEYNDHFAWHQDFSNGVQDSQGKQGIYCVRAIRSF